MALFSCPTCEFWMPIEKDQAEREALMRVWLGHRCVQDEIADKDRRRDAQAALRGKRKPGAG